MPLSDAVPTMMNASMATVPTTNGVMVNLYVQSDGTADDATVAATVQELVDLLQTWSGRYELGDASGTVYEAQMITVTPTNPVPPPDPPEPDPNA